MIRSLVILLLFHLFLSPMRAQELVLNGSFENKSYCPTSFNEHQLKVVENWTQLNEGTPDYFNTCSFKVGIPSNVFGSQEARTGEGYCGMAIYSPGQRNYREYLSTKLTRPLATGEMVCLELYISSADFCKYVVDGFGAVFSKDKVNQERAFVVNIKPQMENPHLHMLDESAEWTLLSDVYQAEGGEEYLTLGNFKSDKDLKVLRRTRLEGADENSKWSYIYIDDVSVKTVKAKSECSCENELLAGLVVDPPLELGEYDDIRLDAVLFDFDEDVLTSEARVQLDEIYSLLRKNKSMYMEIDGHTDAIGNDSYNLGLSTRRADRVIRYLTEKGIDGARLSRAVFGSAQPVAPNSTDEGRAQNRRVEFHIRQKRFELIQ